MVKQKTKNIWASILIILGLLIVTLTHIAIFAMGLPQEMLGGHATINLVAVLLILVGFVIRGWM